ncbi:MAG: phosphodiester glycosidase family protein [Myxococcota bacterium]
MTRPPSLLVGVVLCGLLSASGAFAEDTWTEPAPGVRYLHRQTDEPKDIHALVIDLDTPGLRLRATKAEERGRTVSDFADLVGATAAINGDFYAAGHTPIGLAVGEGHVWPESADTTAWSFLACTSDNRCEIDDSGEARAPGADWHSVVGGNHLLVSDGIARSEAEDEACGEFCTTMHPRTAVGLDEAGRNLIFVVIEGRQPPLLGMGLARVAALLVELGAYTALNLDGGGSSALVVQGERVSDLPSAQLEERPVANHLAVIHDEAAVSTGRLVGFVRAGSVYDTTAGIAAAEVTLSSGESRLSDDSGYFVFDELVPGIVTVHVRAAGYDDASGEREIVAGTTQWRSFALVPSADQAGGQDAGAEEEPPPLDAGHPALDDAGGDADAGEDAPPARNPDGPLPRGPDAETTGGDVEEEAHDTRSSHAAPPMNDDGATLGCRCIARAPSPPSLALFPLACLIRLWSRRRRDPPSLACRVPS